LVERTDVMLYKRSQRLGILSCLILTVLIFAFSACSGPGKSNNAVTEPISVYVMPASRGNIDSRILYTGIVMPEKTAYVSPVISGKVSDSFFEVGGRVKKGDLLFIVENEEIEDNIRILEEQMKAAEAGMALAEAGAVAAMGSGFESQKLQYESALKTAEYNYVAAKKLYDSCCLLYEAKKIDALEYGKARNQFEQAENALETARRSYELFMEHVSRDTARSANEQLKQATASYDAIKLQLESARKKLEYAKVTSPMDGIIAVKDLTEGALVSNTMAPYVIIDIDRVRISVPVTENVIGRIKKGDMLEVSVPAVNKEPFTGEVMTISPAPDPETLTYNVSVGILNENNLIKPGMTAKVLIPSEQRENVVLVPLGSVMSDSSGEFVFIVENDTARKRPVSTGIVKDDMVEIISGINEGEMVVVKGQQFLDHDSPVKITGEGRK